MACSKNYLALDLGAESGRSVIGSFDGGKLALAEAHRFPNNPVLLPDGLHWDALRQFSEIKTGIAKGLQQCGGNVASLGIDTWGVDYGLLDKKGALLGNPYHYRDGRTDGMVEKAFRKATREEIFRITGIQFMQLNTVFQLFAMAATKSPQLEIAQRLLFMPDLFHFWFSGTRCNEYTDASTSQMLDPVARTWALPLLEAFQLPKNILGTLVQPGARLGTLFAPIAQETGLPESLPIIAPATHDTAAAVAAVPAGSGTWCYLSSGTWSLIGVELDRPIIDERSLNYNFTNEAGVGGTTRFLKNVMGLWLVQECRRAWEREGKTYGYDELVRLAEQAAPCAAVVDPDDAGFMLPEHMPRALQEFCRRTGQNVPGDPGAVVRCALDSLALTYRRALGVLEEVSGGRIDVIHIVGGGTQNRLLCQLAADACNRSVIAGPVEATAIGNALMQAVALGDLASTADLREVVRNSFSPQRYEPKDSTMWDDAFARFQKICT